MTTDRMIVQSALATIADSPFSEAAQALLGALGYRSERTLATTGDPADLFGDLPDTQSKRAFLNRAVSAHIVFQVTDAEIASSTDAGGFDAGNVSSFLFVAVALKGQHYSRGCYAQLTREINKRFQMPTVALFKTATNLLTLAFVYRRPHKRDDSRDVLGSVSLIREIDPADPHRAHLDILAELSLGERLAWMEQNHKQRNFDGLLAAWLDALDTEALNRRFYRELSTWFERAGKEATFPTDQAITLPPEEHLIRLITRLLFVWFMQEKGLVAGDLFVEAQVKHLLKDYDRENGDSYYRAVLQNLFFATLNTEMEKRDFSRGGNATHRNFSLYRYEREIADPDKLLDLLAETPFINGGLFDCLDSEEATTDGGYRIDCFTDNVTNPRSNDYGILSIPDRLFFDDDGLIPLFNRYKFTVEENTPVEQEVALDPELLGKVFENLLAAYNPETRDTARKQTGSYYTPRQVVDYMVDEALVASLAQKCQPTDGDLDFWQARLRYLLDYADAFNDAQDLFDANETAGLVRAIAGLKVLDPAVGSGAFPMGVLHKLSLALKRLDPDNAHWEALQKARATERAAAAFDAPTQQERDDELAEISHTFERYRDSDFGRKLYLMQNSIFGVDIQPVACQIAKLRFFISLAIEQEPDPAAENFGIKPLPNLETRFVAADTLLNLKTAAQLDLFRQQTETLKTRLAENRARYFHATTRREKLACKNEDRKLRRELSGVLHAAGLPEDDANKIARWDPYDQNAKADWFDAEYMFGNREGFDVVIGNPPYVQLQKNSGELGNRYKDTGYATFARTGDVYQLFYEKGCQLLKPRYGLLAYITSNSWLKAEYGKVTRRYFAEQHTPLRLLEMGKDVFESAIVDTNVLLLREGKSDETCLAVDVDKQDSRKFPPNDSRWGEMRVQSEKPWVTLSSIERSIMDKMEAVGTPLREWDISIYRGILTGYNKAFIVDEATKEALVAEDAKSVEILKPVLRGRDIGRYRAQWAGLWLIDTHNGYGGVPAININNYPAIKRHLDNFYPQLERRQDKGITPYNLRNCAYHAEFVKEKLIWLELVENGRFAYDDSGTYVEATAFMMTGKNLKYLCALLNARLIRWFIRHTAPTSGMGTLRWKKVYVETVPIPQITRQKQGPIVELIDRVVAAKTGDAKVDVSTLEEDIDQFIYTLYDLTDREIRSVKQEDIA